MKHRIYHISIILLVALFNSPLPAAPDSAIYKGQPRTIAHDFLDLEKDLYPGTEQYAAINTLINKALTVVNFKQNSTTEEAVKTLAQIDALLGNEGFVYKQNYLLGMGIQSKRLDCDNYCVLYIAIAEVMNIPIVPVYAPNHSFLRFYFDDGSYLNWEPTQGRPQPDSYYMETLRINEKSIQKGVYMKTLTRKEFLAVEYNNMGAHLMTQKKFGKAISCFSTAIGLYPLFSSAYHNRGSSYYAAKHIKEALTDLQKANELDPSRASTHNTLGDIYLDSGEHEKALKEYTASIKLAPSNYVPYNTIALIMQKLGRKDKADVWFRKSQEIKAKHERKTD